MSKVIGQVGLAMVLCTGIVVLEGTVAVGSVCYQWIDSFPDERYELDIQVHSLLSEVKEEGKEEVPQQLTFGVFGKHVGTCGGDTVRPVVGSLISTVPVGMPSQARMGLISTNTTGAPIFCRDVEVSCVSVDGSGFPPPVWDCFGQNKFGDEFEFQLRRVDEAEDPRCGLFEGGASGKDADHTPLESKEQQPASGLKVQ